MKIESLQRYRVLAQMGFFTLFTVTPLFERAQGGALSWTGNLPVRADRALREAWNRQLESFRDRGVLAHFEATWL